MFLIQMELDPLNTFLLQCKLCFTLLVEGLFSGSGVCWLCLDPAVRMRDAQWYPAPRMPSYRTRSPLHAYSQVVSILPSGLQHSGGGCFLFVNPNHGFLPIYTPEKCFLSWLVTQPTPQSGVSSLPGNSRPALVQATLKTSSRSGATTTATLSPTRSES